MTSSAPGGPRSTVRDRFSTSKNPSRGLYLQASGVPDWRAQASRATHVAGRRSAPRAQLGSRAMAGGDSCRLLSRRAGRAWTPEVPAPARISSPLARPSSAASCSPPPPPPSMMLLSRQPTPDTTRQSPRASTAAAPPLLIEPEGDHEAHIRATGRGFSEAFADVANSGQSRGTVRWWAGTPPSPSACARAVPAQYTSACAHICRCTRRSTRREAERSGSRRNRKKFSPPRFAARHMPTRRHSEQHLLRPLLASSATMSKHCQLPSLFGLRRSMPYWPYRLSSQTRRFHCKAIPAIQDRQRSQQLGLFFRSWSAGTSEPQVPSRGSPKRLPTVDKARTGRAGPRPGSDDRTNFAGVNILQRPRRRRRRLPCAPPPRRRRLF